MPSTSGRTLAAAQTGERVVLADPELPRDRARRLAELGLRAGRTVQVLHRTSGGGRIVAVEGARIAVDRQTLTHLPLAGPADRERAG